MLDSCFPKLLQARSPQRPSFGVCVLAAAVGRCCTSRCASRQQDDQAKRVPAAEPSLPESENPVESWAAELLLGILRFYRQYISPSLPPNCRYVPSCSRLRLHFSPVLGRISSSLPSGRYGIEVVKRYGALKGLILFLWRLLRCTPLEPRQRHCCTSSRFASNFQK